MSEILDERRRKADSPISKIKSISITLAWTVVGIVFTAAVTMGMYQERISNIVLTIREDKGAVAKNSTDIINLEKRMILMENTVSRMDKLAEKMEDMADEMHALALAVAQDRGTKWWSNEKRSPRGR